MSSDSPASASESERSLSDLNREFRVAAVKNKLETCVELLEKGADIDGRGIRGRTALHMAAKRGLLQMCTWLLDKGASVLAKDNMGLRPLHHAVQSAGSLEVCELLLSRGATHEPTNAGDTPLHFAARGLVRKKHKSEIEFVDMTGICALLVDRGAAINAVNDMGNTALHYACMFNQLGLCTLLLEKGAVQTENTIKRQTPLHLAADANNAEMCKLLLRRGAEHSLDIFGETPLHLALTNWNDTSRAVCAVLVEHGAPVKCRHSLIHKVIRKLFSDNLEDAPCCGYFYGENKAVDAIKWLLDQGADIEEADHAEIMDMRIRLTPLEYACETLQVSRRFWSIAHDFV